MLFPCRPFHLNWRHGVEFFPVREPPTPTRPRVSWFHIGMKNQPSCNLRLRDLRFGPVLGEKNGGKDLQWKGPFEPSKKPKFWGGFRILSRVEHANGDPEQLWSKIFPLKMYQKCWKTNKKQQKIEVCFCSYLMRICFNEVFFPCRSWPPKNLHPTS